MDERGDEAPEFGPGGYLPDRASRRARKIVLRAPMGLQWVVGSLVVGVVVLVAGALLLRDTPPGPPYVAVGEDLVLQGVPGVEGQLFVVVEGRPRAFSRDGDVPVRCAENGLLESADGGVWRPTGRGLGGTPSLTEHPTVVHEGTVYVDPTRTLPTLPPDDEPVEQACGGAAPTSAPTSTPTDEG